MIKHMCMSFALLLVCEIRFEACYGLKKQNSSQAREPKKYEIVVASAPVIDSESDVDQDSVDSEELNPLIEHKKTIIWQKIIDSRKRKQAIEGTVATVLSEYSSGSSNSFVSARIQEEGESSFIVQLKQSSTRFDSNTMFLEEHDSSQKSKCSSVQDIACVVRRFMQRTQDIQNGESKSLEQPMLKKLRSESPVPKQPIKKNESMVLFTTSSDSHVSASMMAD